MKLHYKTKKLEKECNNFRKAQIRYGDNCAKKLHQRVRELQAADTLDEMVEYRIGRCHRLTGDYNGKFALDLAHPFRLVVEPIENPCGEISGIQIVRLLEVTNYHGS